VSLWRLVGAMVAALTLAGCAARLPLPAEPAAMAAMRADPARMIVLAVASRPESGPTGAGSTAGYRGGRLYAAGSGARATLDTLAREYRLREMAGWPIEALDLYCVVVEAADAEDALRRLQRDGRVALAQPLNTFQTLSDEAYNDPYLRLQTGFRDIDAAAAQRAGGRAAVKVAVIDTGVDTRHPDLRGRVLLARSFVDGGAAFDGDRHGTEVAGIIAANANNRTGIVGIAPQAQVIALKACWHASGPNDARAVCNTFTLAQALVAAMNAQARVINLSLGGPADPLLARLVAEAVRRGIVVVGAVPPSGDVSGFPVGVAGVIGVDAAGRSAAAPIVQAPGREVLTLRPGGHYDFSSGSSLATAHVSGVAALLLASGEGLGARQIHAALLESSGTAGAYARMINACRALGSVLAARPISCQ
jgi:subtilisin family serine protease